MALVELLERGTVVVIFHRNPAPESIPTPAFLPVDEYGVFTTIGWYPDTLFL
jgi:hypothetical protein